MRSSKIDGLAVYAGLFLIFLYGPILLLPLFSFNDSIFIAFPLRGFTIKWYQAMVSDSAIISGLSNSLKVGSVVAVLSAALGLLAAKAVTRYRLPGRGLVMGIIVLPIVLPSIILGVAILVIVRKILDVQLSLLTIGAGHLLVCTPFSMLLLVSRLEGFDANLEEASLDLGENGWMTFWRVTFPLALPGIVSSLLLAFTVSFDEFVIAFFLAGNDSTLPLIIWSQVRFPGKLPSVLALGSCIFMITLILVVVAELIRRRGLDATKLDAL
jgi:spermidine/putrescine transport system permease protein